MLAERIPLEVMCRVMEIEAHQVYTYVDGLCDEVPQDLVGSVRDTVDIELVKVDSELDELCRVAGAEFCGLESQQKMALAGS